MSLALLGLYSATAAPDITLWDSGEFNAAIGSLGIPHPPGTPLYILLAATWARALGFLPQALAVNLLSAAATALACGLLGGLVARWTASRLSGIAAGIMSGSMLAVWLNATETEVYALSFLLAVLMLVAGERAGATGRGVHRVLLSYLIALAVPLQISALVAAPAAIMLASTHSESTWPSWRPALAPLGVLVLVTGAGTGSLPVAGGGALVLLGAFLVARDAPELRNVAGQAAVALLGLSVTVFLLVRAQHDPAVNQGNPSTLDGFVAVVSRSQYAVPPLWPRQAPVWVQLLNLVQYADWQVASGLDQGVAASWWRTPWSIAALALSMAGARALVARNRRAGVATLALAAIASLGVVLILNLRAGPSVLDRVLPAGALHEARERDYFFALAFAVVGAMAGLGAVALARRRLTRWPAWSGLVVVALPVLLNFRAADRRPEGALASTLGEALLASSPPDAVVVVAGDNDTYSMWYRQAVWRERPDVVPVTVPLLAARWYRAELARRHGLLDSATVADWHGEAATLSVIAGRAQAAGRPLAAAVTVPRGLRAPLAPAWTLGGMVYVADRRSAPARADSVDRPVTARIMALVTSRGLRHREVRDPAASYVFAVLRCPAQALQLGVSGAAPLLDSRCNFK